MPNIPPIFVISLRKETQRRQHITDQLSHFDLDFEFVDAVDGTLLDDKTLHKIYSKEQSIQEIDRYLSKGEIGCALSHLSAYQKMLDEGIDKAIILEDDAVIFADFIDVINNIQYATPQKWQLILLGYSTRNTHPKVCQVSVSKPNKSLNFTLKKPLSIAYCTHAYLINQDGAAHILSQTKVLSAPIDHYTGNYKLIDVYCVNPLCVGADYDLPSALFDERMAMRKQVLADRYEKLHAERQEFIRQKSKTSKFFRIKQDLKRKYTIIRVLVEFRQRIRDKPKYQSCITRIFLYKTRKLWR